MKEYLCEPAAFGVRENIHCDLFYYYKVMLIIKSFKERHSAGRTILKGFKKKKKGLEERDYGGNDNAGFSIVFVAFCMRKSPRE